MQMFKLFAKKRMVFQKFWYVDSDNEWGVSGGIEAVRTLFRQEGGHWLVLNFVWMSFMWTVPNW